jgi:DNA polymerase-3 subunit delta'
MTDHPQPDCLPGAPHPRQAAQLFGQDVAEAAFLDALSHDRLHHAWMITGPEGIGKATLAWRIARFLLATPVQHGGLFNAPPPPSSLDIAPEHPVARHLLAGSEPRALVLRRPFDEKNNRLKQDITVEEVRGLHRFFGLSATEGGRRVVIVDSADDMNTSAANALLKLLEEPPKDAVLLLIAHQPARLLPTIRSRCRTLRCAPLNADDLAAALVQAEAMESADPHALSVLAQGSAGRAFRLLQGDGVQLYRDLIALIGQAPNMPRPQILALSESVQGAAAAERMEVLVTLIAFALNRLAKTGAMGQLPDVLDFEAQALARLSNSPAKARAWADLAQHLSARIDHGRAVNLDPSALILDTLLQIEATAAG